MITGDGAGNDGPWCLSRSGEAQCAHRARARQVQMIQQTPLTCVVYVLPFKLLR